MHTNSIYSAMTERISGVMGYGINQQRDSSFNRLRMNSNGGKATDLAVSLAVFDKAENCSYWN